MEQQIQQQQTPPPNYLVFAILATIFCCQILGIVSIVSAQVNSKWTSGDIQGAMDASKNAKLWAWIAFGSGLLIAVVVGLLSIFGILAGLALG